VLLDGSAPVKLPTAKYIVTAMSFAAKTRKSKHAKRAFDVDLGAETVDFASCAHRSAASEAEAARAKSAWKCLHWHLEVKQTLCS
jgi:hypothetical protein